MSTNVIELPGGHDRESGVRQQVADNLTAELARKRISGRDAAKALGLTEIWRAKQAHLATAFHKLTKNGGRKSEDSG